MQAMTSSTFLHAACSWLRLLPACTWVRSRWTWTWRERTGRQTWASVTQLWLLQLPRSDTRGRHDHTNSCCWRDKRFLFFLFDDVFLGSPGPSNHRFTPVKPDWGGVVLHPCACAGSCMSGWGGGGGRGCAEVGGPAGRGRVDLVGGGRKGAELHLPDICGWMAGCSPLLSSCAWMVSTTRLKRRLGPDGGNQGNAGQPLIVSPRGSGRYYNNTTSTKQTPPSEGEREESARCGRSYPIT